MDDTEGGRDARAGRIEGLVQPILEAMGYDLVRVLVSGRTSPLLQVMAERKDDRPMHVDDCAEISRAVSAALDAADPIAGSYTLEVSSPGLDRPLTKAADYARFAGHAARVETARPIDGRRKFRGRLAGLDGRLVRMETPEGPVSVPFDDIARGRLVVDEDTMREALRRQANTDANPGDGRPARNKRQRRG
ncbi:MAG: ribosome maturation factor RimP [Alphaproteobacteria bacterium]|nr:ribosome maturation factor RimP [Alphaproteobacteria bacterium]